MIEVKRLEGYDEGLAAEMGRLTTFVSSHGGYDGRPLTRGWMEEVIKSPYHDELLAFDGDKLVGMAMMSIVFVPSYGRNAYLEELVVDEACQGKGVGSLLWNAILEWGREKGARRLEFSASGNSAKKAKAVEFYLHKGAGIHQTNFFRYELGGGDE